MTSIRTRRATVAGVVAATATTATILLGAGPVGAAHEGVVVVGLTQHDRLVTFLADDPGTILDSVPLTGIEGELVGLDYRPAVDDLYGVVRRDDGTGALVLIDDDTGAATTIAPLVAAGAPVVLDGDAFGVDFNPVADRLRVVSDTGQNLRIATDRGTGVAGATIVDGTLRAADGRDPDVVAAAYTNSDTDPATGTALYDIDTADDTLVLQDANPGTLSDVGPLGLRAGRKVGFDIATDRGTNVALVSVFDRGRSTLSVVNLTTGAVNPASTEEIGSTPHVVDIAVPTDQ